MGALAVAPLAGAIEDAAEAGEAVAATLVDALDEAFAATLRDGEAWRGVTAAAA